jgi:site-specific recombinase XerD
VDTRIHDLRHSYASIAVGAGIGLYLTGKILGHLRNTTTERYAHLADDPIRQANELVGKRISDALGHTLGDIETPLFTGRRGIPD